MIFNLPKKEDRNLLYELYYIHGICFAKLMGPKERPTQTQFENANVPQAKKVLRLNRHCERGR